MPDGPEFDPDEPAQAQEFPLPDPPPGWDEPPADGEPSLPEPEQWPGPVPGPEDPVPRHAPHVDTPAALFVSDLHMSDGAVGDDFIDGNLAAFGSLIVGAPGPAPSRARLLVQVITFVIARAAALGIPRIDVVLAGDIIDGLELRGRGTRLAAAHRGLFNYFARLPASGHTVHYLRGNHDWTVPRGPWIPGAFYANGALTTLAEHGDFFDKNNWPPGPAANPGSLLVAGAGGIPGTAKLEVVASGWLHQRLGHARYEWAAIDNLQPFSGQALDDFIERRLDVLDRVVRAIIDLRSPGAAVARRILVELAKWYIGTPDDSANRAGANARRTVRPGWLSVQGHTHIPAAVPGVYYNLGTWTPTVVAAPTGAEQLLQIYPFLFVYPRNAARVEEYFTVNVVPAGPRAVLRNRASVNQVRGAVGFPPM